MALFALRSVKTEFAPWVGSPRITLFRQKSNSSKNPFAFALLRLMPHDLAKPVSITLPWSDWCLLVGVLSGIIEQTIEMQDPRVRQQTADFSRIREVIDRATDL